MTMDSSMAG